MSKDSLRGKIAFVTGAARGQGRSHCVELARAGADIVAIDITAPINSTFYRLADPEDLDETAKLVAAQGRQVIARQADVRSSQQLSAMVDETVSELGPVDIVVANAGISTSLCKTWEISDIDWHDVLDVNLTGVFYTIRAVVPSMIEAGNGGSIVLTSSMAGLRGIPHIAGYTASKHGVIGLMKTLANELAPNGIRVNSVCPSVVNTEFVMNQATYDLFRPDLVSPTKDDAIEVFRRMHLLPMDWIEPSDISEAVVWLSSDSARFITGLAMTIDGGRMVMH